ncbi:hypothetical protein PN4B1_49180 [Paenibacillus naphthalenovorans]|nr:hypothetical protein PN4B1_49180 [Paenibacillus naphthalenovorans]
MGIYVDMFKGVFGVRRESFKKRIGEMMTMIRNMLMDFGSFLIGGEHEEPKHLARLSMIT